jgi:hypothetical protein
MIKFDMTLLKVFFLNDGQKNYFKNTLQGVLIWQEQNANKLVLQANIGQRLDFFDQR